MEIKLHGSTIIIHKNTHLGIGITIFFSSLIFSITQKDDLFIDSFIIQKIVNSTILMKPVDN